MIDFRNLMTEEELTFIGMALKAALDVSVFPDDEEFDILMGVSRGVVADICKSWPEFSVVSDELYLSVVGSMNNLSGYPHGRVQYIENLFEGSFGSVGKVLDKFIEVYPKPSGAVKL